MSEIYSIINLEKYASYIRKKAAVSYSAHYEQELIEQEKDLNDFVTIAQVCGLIEECSIGKDEHGKFLLNEEAYESLYEKVRIRIYNCGLSKLSVSGQLECAWDEVTNEMVFWPSATD